MNVVKDGIESFNETVNNLGSSFEEAETRISLLEDEEAKASSVRVNLMKQNHGLQEKLTPLEGFSLQQNIKISGVKEGTKGPDLEGCLRTLIYKALDIATTQYCLFSSLSCHHDLLVG